MAETFLTEDFLLQSETARSLYHDHAAKMPIYDYHCHLSAEQIAGDYQFVNLSQAWLYGDHYKWRAMRANGVDERFITGEGSDFEKFQAWAETVHDQGTNGLTIPPPSSGELVSLDGGQLVTPPAGLERGYVPIAIGQRDATAGRRGVRRP